MLPSVNTTLTLLLPPAALLHCSDVSDTHALCSHPVTPTRASALDPCVQKLSPTTLIMVADAPRMFTSSPLTPSRPPPLTTALSYDTAVLMLITCSPTVNLTRRVFVTPAGVLHITLLSEVHSLVSPDV